MKQIYKNLLNYLLVILGVIILSIFIWLRFIRERLPRAIPFDLSILGLLILLVICIIYLFIIINLFFGLNSNSKQLTSIINTIYRPLYAVDENIKNNVKLKPYSEKYLVYIINILKKTNTFYNQNKIIDYLHIYYIFQIFPRIVLIIALLVDTFGFIIFFSSIKPYGFLYSYS
jgi:hypothetical protein